MPQAKIAAPKKKLKISPRKKSIAGSVKSSKTDTEIDYEVRFPRDPIHPVSKIF